MSRAEEFFYPIYLFLMALSYIYFFLRMIPGMAAAALLGWFHGGTVLSRLTGEDRRGTLAAGLWDLAALVLSVFLGGLNGWWLLFDSKGKLWGGCLALGAYLLARVLSAIQRKKRRGR